MKKINHKVLFIVLLIIVNFTFFVVGYINYLYPRLSEFNIINVDSNGDTLVLNVSPSLHAMKYEIEVSHNDEVVYQTTSESEKISLDEFYPEYANDYSINVQAVNKNNEKKDSQNTFNYQNLEPSIDKTENHFNTEGRDLVLNVLGYNNNETLYMELYYQKNKIPETIVNDSNVVIPSSELMGYSGRITALLKNTSNRVLSTFNFYLNMPLIGNLKVLSPNDNFESRWNDILLSFSGGENATDFNISLIKDNVLMEEISVPKDTKQYLITAEHFLENSEYDIVLKASYEGDELTAKKSKVHVKIGKKETTNPVYVSHNPTFIRAGTMVTLQSMTANATIYYTTDGSIPNASSSIYKEPIKITGDTTIKTYAYTNNRFDSVINTYDFKVKDKNLVIYLSPSNQDGNYGVSDVNYQTEMYRMNQIADVVERKLKESGVLVYRNNPSGDINAWTSVSNSVKADFHLAIHSNASSFHTARGIEIFVDNETSKSFSIAANIYENLWKIYPDNKNYTYHRGVKYARGSLGEVNDNYLPCGSLIEIAYHDNIEDASWIVNNIDEIGNNIASSILNYFN